jgi:hypothetical protein
MQDDQVVDPQAIESEESAAAVEETATIESESAADEQEEQKPKSGESKGGFQRRIDKLTKEKADKERELEYWREQALRSQPKEEPKEAPKTPERPTRDAFASEEDFFDALTDWKLDRRQEKAAQEQKQREAVQPIFEARTKFAEKVPDFHQVLSAAKDVPVTEAMMPFLNDPEIGAPLSYYLAKNPEQAVKLSKMGPAAVARAIVELTPNFTEEEEPEEKPVARTTAAPRPPKPVGSNSKETGIDPYSETDPRKFDEWFRKTYNRS